MLLASAGQANATSESTSHQHVAARTCGSDSRIKVTIKGTPGKYVSVYIRGATPSGASGLYTNSGYINSAGTFAWHTPVRQSWGDIYSTGYPDPAAVNASGGLKSMVDACVLG
jgi:hypothetical protein